MPDEEFRKSITDEEYSEGMKAVAYFKSKTKYKHKFKAVSPTPHWRTVKSDVSKKLDEFLKTYISGKKRKKSNYPAIFRKKQVVLKKEIGRCLECGSSKYLQVHHIDKNKFNNEDYNLKLLCYNCHKAIHKHLYLPSFIKQYG